MTSASPPLLQARIVEALRAVEGVAAVALGGSRARGAAMPSSDTDIGVYYHRDAPFPVATLRAALAPLCDDPDACALTDIGAWGPWIDGGGWLSMSGEKVDILYRDVARVRDVIADCGAGRIAMNYQPGHPHGFCSAILMGEAALCQPLLDPSGALAALKQSTDPYPDALRRAVIGKFHWEARFSAANAETTIARDDPAHVAGCAYRALCCIAQVLFATNRRYLINEKGAIDEAARLPATISGLATSTRAVWSDIGSGDPAGAVRRLFKLADDLDRVVGDAG